MPNRRPDHHRNPSRGVDRLRPRLRRQESVLPAIIAILLVGSGIALVGFGQRAFSSGKSSVPASSTRSRAPARNSSAVTSIKDTDWNAVLQRWWQESKKTGAASGSTPETTPEPEPLVASTKPLVMIDVAAVAQRHPSWQLAAALERDPDLPLDFQAIAVQPVNVSTGRVSLPSSRLPRPPLSEVAVPPAAFSGVRAVASTLPPPATGSDSSEEVVEPPDTLDGLSRPETRVVADELSEQQDAARERQNLAMDDFLAQAVLRQERARAQLTRLEIASLEEEFAMEERFDLDALTPLLPPDALQLRIINLRLELLENVSNTPEEREAARQELAALEEEWRLRLQGQAAERMEQIQALRQERRQREEQARTKFAVGQERAQESDAKVREAVLQAHRERVQTDFRGKDAVLSIVLPAFSAPEVSPQDALFVINPQNTARQHTGSSARVPFLRSTPGGLFMRRNGNRSGAYKFETVAPVLPSMRTLPRNGVQEVTAKVLPGTTSAGGAVKRAQAIRDLRAQAWRESWRWSQIVAHRNGWNWVEKRLAPDVMPADKTSEVIGVLGIS